MPEWRQPVDLDTDNLTAIAESATEFCGTAADVLHATSSALGALSDFLIVGPNAWRSAAFAVLNSLEAFFADFLKNNVAMAVHLNLVWDPTWTKESDSVPWSGNGMKGWFSAVASSAYDKTDPNRPVTDTETSVGGFVFVLGTYDTGNLGYLKYLVDGFGDFSRFGEWATTLEEWSTTERSARTNAMARLGSGVSSLSVRSASDVDSVQAAVAALGVDSDFRPLPGNYPKWYSVPLAAAFPPLHELFTLLRQFVASIRPASDLADIFAQLVDLLRSKAEQLEDIAERMEDVISTLVSLLALLENGYFLYLPREAGGMTGFVARALAADNMPDFGTDGIVGGVVGVATADDPMNHLEVLLSTLKITVEGTTQRQQNVEDAFADVPWS